MGRGPGWVTCTRPRSTVLLLRVEECRYVVVEGLGEPERELARPPSAAWWSLLSLDPEWSEEEKVDEVTE